MTATKPFIPPHTINPPAPRTVTLTAHLRRTPVYGPTFFYVALGTPSDIAAAAAYVSADTVTFPNVDADRTYDITADTDIRALVGSVHFV